MKITVEFELDDSWDAYIPDNKEKIRNIIRPDLDGVNYEIIKSFKITKNEY